MKKMTSEQRSLLETFYSTHSDPKFGSRLRVSNAETLLGKTLDEYLGTVSDGDLKNMITSYVVSTNAVIVFGSPVSTVEKNNVYMSIYNSIPVTNKNRNGFVFENEHRIRSRLYYRILAGLNKQADEPSLADCVRSIKKSVDSRIEHLVAPGPLTDQRTILRYCFLLDSILEMSSRHWVDMVCADHPSKINRDSGAEYLGSLGRASHSVSLPYEKRQTACNNLYNYMLLSQSNPESKSIVQSIVSRMSSTGVASRSSSELVESMAVLDLTDDEDEDGEDRGWDKEVATDASGWSVSLDSSDEHTREFICDLISDLSKYGFISNKELSGIVFRYASSSSNVLENEMVLNEAKYVFIDSDRDVYSALMDHLCEHLMATGARLSDIVVERILAWLDEAASIGSESVYWASGARHTFSNESRYYEIVSKMLVISPEMIISKFDGGSSFSIWNVKRSFCIAVCSLLSEAFDTETSEDFAECLAHAEVHNRCCYMKGREIYAVTKALGRIENFILLHPPRGKSGMDLSIFDIFPDEKIQSMVASFMDTAKK